MSARANRRQLVYAGLSAGCLLLFSMLNGYQKYQAALPHGHSVPFVLNIILLALAAAAGLRALSDMPAASPARPAYTGAKTYDPLLTLRAFACFMVLLGHAMSFTYRPPDLIPAIQSGSSIWLITAAAEPGVWIFFTLSGYLIGKGFFAGRYVTSRASLAQFYLNRTLRIVPVYWFTLLVFSALFIRAIFAPQNWPAFFNMMLFNVDGNLPYLPIGALWSLSTEMQFYALAPMLFMLLQACLAWPARFALASCLLSGGSIIWRAMAFHDGGLQGWWHVAYAPLFINLDLFWTGMAASRLVLHGQVKNLVFRHGLRIGFITLGCLYTLTTYLRSHTALITTPIASIAFTAAGPTLTALLTALVIICFEHAPRAPAGSLTYRLGHPTEQLGLLTFAAYAWHEPIYLVLKEYTGTPASIPMSLAVFVLALTSVFAAALVIYHLVERPFERLKGRQIFIFKQARPGFFMNKKAVKKTL